MMRMTGWMSAAVLAGASMAAGAQAPKLAQWTVRYVPLAAASGVTAGTTGRTEPGDPQVKDDLFAGTEKFAQGAKEVTEVNLDKNMLGMVSHGKHGEDIAGKMDFIVVHTYEYEKPGMYRQEDVDQFRRKLTDGSWNCFIHT